MEPSRPNSWVSAVLKEKNDNAIRQGSWHGASSGGSGKAGFSSAGQQRMGTWLSNTNTGGNGPAEGVCGVADAVDDVSDMELQEDHKRFGGGEGAEDEEDAQQEKKGRRGQRGTTRTR